MSGQRKWSEAKPGRLGALARLPLFFALEAKRAVIAGGGPAAAWKAELLSGSGAVVEVFCVDVTDEMLQVAGDPPRGEIIIHRREWTAADLHGAALAIGDFGDDKRAAAFSRAARAAGVPVNVIDKPEFCDFSFGAVVNRSPLVIGISTDGAAPVFAQAIRGKLESLLPKGLGYWTAAAARWRHAVQASGLSFAARRKFWQLFTAHAMAGPDNVPDQGDFDRFIAGAVGASRRSQRGSVTSVSLDRDPESLTLRAIRALQSADVILFDDQVPGEVLDFARREARKIHLGDINRDDFGRRKIDALSVDFVRQGKRVVVVTGQGRDQCVGETLFRAA